MPMELRRWKKLWRGAKKCRDDQWQAAGPKFHFVYWDACGGDAEGFFSGREAAVFQVLGVL